MLKYQAKITTRTHVTPFYTMICLKTPDADNQQYS